MHEALALLEASGGRNPFAEGVLARAQAQEAIEDAAEARRAKARRADAEQRAETMALLNRQWGDPIGNVRRCQAEMTDLSETVADLESQLARAKRRRDSCRSNLEWWSGRLTLADAGTRRSSPPDPVEAAAMRAADALREVHEGRTVVERARRSVRGRRP